MQIANKKFIGQCKPVIEDNILSQSKRSASHKESNICTPISLLMESVEYNYDHTQAKRRNQVKKCHTSGSSTDGYP